MACFQPFNPVVGLFPGPDRSHLLSEEYGMSEFVYFDHYHYLHVLVSYLGAGACRYCLVESFGISADVLSIVVWYYGI